MSKATMWCVQFTGQNFANTERKQFYEFFGTIGKVTKLYVPPGQDYGSVYFEDRITAQKVVQFLNNSPPLFLNLKINFDRSQSNVEIVNTSCCSNSSSSVDMSEVDASMGDILYCVHGHQIETFLDDNNEVYVPLDKLGCIGFKLYETKDTLDRLTYNKEMENIFEIYMQQKAKNFMVRNNYKLPDSLVTNTIESCKPMVFENVANSTPINNTTSPKRSGHLRNNNARNGYRRSNNFTTNTNQTTNQQMNKSTPNVRHNENPSHNRGFRNNKNMTSPENKNEKKMLPASTPVPALKYMQLKLNIIQDVIVSFIDETVTFITLKENQKLVERLLMDTIKSASMNKSIPPVLGKLCAAMYAGAWYRAIVTATNPKLQVKYIDYGNYNQEIIKEVRDLPLESTTEPAQAIKIRFQNPPKIQLKINQELKIKPIQMDPDGCFVVVLENNCQTPNKSLPILKDSKVDGLRKPIQPVRLDKSVVHKELPPKICKISPVSSLSSNTTVTNYSKINNRKCAADIPCRDAYLELTHSIGSNSFVAFVFQKSLFEDLNKLDCIVGEEIEPFYNPNIGDTVSVQREEGGETSWVRGLILSIKGCMYDLALIDYGVIMTTDKICPLKKEFEDIVEFSCFSEVDSRYMPELLEKKKIQCEILKENHIIIKLDCGPVPVISFKWNPFQTHSYNPPPSPELVITTLPKTKPLKEGELVVIVAEDKGCLYVQTRGGYQIFKDIEKELNVTTVNNLNTKPIVNQLVLHECEGKGHQCRGIIKTIDENNALVHYLDYGVTDLVPWRNISNITEKLAQINCTLTKVKLQDCDSCSFSSKALDELARCSANKEKFAVILTSRAAVVNLKDANGNMLSDRLKTKEIVHPKRNGLLGSNVILKKDLYELEVPYGNHTLICMFNGELEKGLIAFCYTVDTKEFNKLSEDIEQYNAGSKKPYKPVLNEVCLALCEDVWYRAVVTDIEDDSNLVVYFLDYGNHMQLTVNEIRSIPSKMTELPLVAMLCQLKDLKEILATNLKVYEKVSNILQEGSCYTVNVISREKNVYNITIPQVVDALKAENLI